MAALLELFVLVILSGRIRPHDYRGSENIVHPFENDVDDSESGNAVQQNNNSAENALKGGKSLTSLISKIDKWAFWIFNFAFIIFNCGYWTKCLA